MKILKLKKVDFIAIRSFLGDADIEKVLVSKKIAFGGKTINTLLVTCIMVIKFNH